LLRVVQDAAMDDRRELLSDLNQPAWEPSWTAARDYLESVAERLRIRGMHVRAHVVGGRPADEILKEAGRVRADLIALATHACGSFKRLLRGSVSDHLHRNSAIPLMVQRSLPGGQRVTNHALSKTG
jgi:nucleotide-binding universal stress UspA family protein